MRRCWRPLLIIALTALWQTVARSEETPPKPDTRTIRVMTYNILYGRHIKDGQDKIVALLKEQAPDVLCLQETKWRAEKNGPGSGQPDEIATAIGGRNWCAVSRNGVEGDETAGTWSRGPAIVTRGRIIRYEPVAVTGSQPFALLAEIEINNHRLIVVSAHFHSIAGATVGGVASTESARIREAKLLKARLSQEHLPIVIGCDLNALPFFPSYQELADPFRDTALIFGDNDYTRKTRGLPARIDYLFISKHWAATHYSVEPVDFSDHRPVRAEISLK